MACDVCDAADEINDSTDKAISKIGYDAKANPQYLTYCIVWEKDGVQQPLSEVLNPYEFNHYKSTWDELKGFYMAGGRKCEDSVLDYELGNEFCVMRTQTKGTRLDKLDSVPIFDLNEPKWDEYIKKIEAGIKTPKVVIPTASEMRIFAQKLHEFAERAAGRGGDEDETPRGRSADRGGSRYADDADPDAEVAPRRRAAATVAPKESVDEDAEPERPVTARRASTARVADDAGAEADAGLAPARRRAAEPDPEDAVPERRRATASTAAPETETPRRREPVAASRRTVAEPDPEPAEPADPEPAEPAPAAANRRTLEPTARRTAAPAAAAEPEDPEDILPEEVVDVAPAAPARTRAKAEVVADPEQPTPVARRGGAAAAGAGAAAAGAGAAAAPESAAGAAVAARLCNLPRNA